MLSMSGSSGVAFDWLTLLLVEAAAGLCATLLTVFRGVVGRVGCVLVLVVWLVSSRLVTDW